MEVLPRPSALRQSLAVTSNTDLFKFSELKFGSIVSWSYQQETLANMSQYLWWLMSVRAKSWNAQHGPATTTRPFLPEASAMESSIVVTSLMKRRPCALETQAWWVKVVKWHKLQIFCLWHLAKDQGITWVVVMVLAVLLHLSHFLF